MTKSVLNMYSLPLVVEANHLSAAAEAAYRTMMRFVLICLVAGAFAYPNSGHDNPYYTSWDNGQYPPSRASTEDSANACMPGHGGTTGFACTHMAMLSDDMMLAAEKDGHANHFVYAVAGQGCKLRTPHLF